MQVVNNESTRRFEVTIDGQTGFLQYDRNGGRLVLMHTEVPPSLGSRGLGGLLARTALEYARDSSLKVTPACPFVRSFLKRHPEYEPLL